MFPNFKPLIPVLGLAWVMFQMLKPLCLTCTSLATFQRRMKVWFALTIFAFLSPSFGLYAIFAIPLLWWAGKQESNPLGLFALLTFVIPNARFYIPTVVIGQLFDLTQYRLLSLFVLLPAIVRWNSEVKYIKPQRAWTIQETIFAGYLSIFVFTNVPYESTTASMRRTFLLCIDWLIILYTFSRLRDRRQIADVLGTFCLSVGIMSAVGIFEWAKGWLLYTGLASEWGDPNIFSWLMRGDRLRAQAAAQHSLNLGYHVAMALVLYTSLRHRLPRGWRDLAILVIFAWALYATGSRGPWLTAVLGLLLYSLTRPQAARNFARAVLGAVLAFGVMYVTPLRETVLDRLPVIGTAEQDTVEYRTQLASLSWDLVWRSPIFGDPRVTVYMESLRQGQGIIDIVNGYLYTLLFTGWTGLLLQAGGFVSGLWVAWRGLYAMRSTDPELSAMGGGLLAAFGASLFFIAAAGYGPTTYFFLGLLFSFGAVCRDASQAIEPRSAIGVVGPMLKRNAAVYRTTASAPAP